LFLSDVVNPIEVNFTRIISCFTGTLKNPLNIEFFFRTEEKEKKVYGMPKLKGWGKNITF